jgi:HEAT repeat protein
MKASLVALSLVALAAQHDVNAAAAGLSSGDPAARAHAACALRDLGSEATPFMARLGTMLEDGSPVDGAVCGERTWHFRGAPHQDWGQPPEPTTPGEQAAAALVAIGGPARPLLRTTLGSPAWIARRNAAWALGASKDSEAVPALVDALKDGDAGVREQVAWALGAIGDHRAVDGLVAALGDSVAGVRKQVAWALGAIGDRRAVQGLMRLLKDADAGVRKQAAWALGAIGG